MTPVVFAGNDYLGLARDPRLAEAACRAAREHGISPTSGRFFLGWTELHKQLERDLAAFFGTEDACLLPAAYLGGLATSASAMPATPPSREPTCSARPPAPATPPRTLTASMPRWARSPPDAG